MAFERRVASVVSLAKGKKRKENKDLYKKWNYDRTETLVKGVEVESIYFRAWSFEEYFTRRKVERFFGKSDLESNEERSGKVFFQKRGKKRVKELEYGISLPCLFIHLTTLRLRTTKKRRLRGRDERGHMSRGRKKRVRTVSSRFYFASCPFLFGISGTTRKWREHEFHRFLTYSALLRLFPRRRYEVKNNIISLSERDPRSCTLVVSRFE